MQTPLTYIKTAAGQEEIRSRSDHLTRPMRNLLLCVDGKRSATELEALVRASGAPGDSLEQLLQLGLIVATTPPRPASPAVSGTVEADDDLERDRTGPETLEPFDATFDAASAPSGDYAELYGRMNALVSEHLGLLKAYGLQLKIEQCNSVEQLRSLIPELEAALDRAVGRERARDYLAGL